MYRRVLSEEEILKILEESDCGEFSSDEEESTPTQSIPVQCSNDDEGGGGEEEDEDEDDDDNGQGKENGPTDKGNPDSATNGPTSNRRQLFRKTTFTGKCHPNPKDYTTQNPNPVRTPAQYFSDYYSDEFFDIGAQYTNMYSVAKTGKSLKTTPSELKRFFGVNLVMGCIPYPRLRMYWQNGIGMLLVSECMSRDRFLSLRSNIHFVDTVSQPDDANTNRLWKIQPVIDAVRSACEKLPRDFGSYSIDEQMIPFTGRCSLKQYVKNKPRPVGLKNFVVTSSTGVVLDFEIYQGAATQLPNKELGLGPSVVMRLVRSLPVGSFVYFDRYFTTLPLLASLADKGIEGTGTIMVNRIKNVNLKVGKMERGESYEYVRSDDAVVVVEWKDNQKVVLASTCTGIEPAVQVRRWCKKQGKFIEVSCPQVVKRYNQNMGGVDIVDQQMECYRTWFKTRKWTLKCILHFLDLSAVNSWFVYREDCRANKIPEKNIMDLLKFRLSIAEALMATPDRSRRVATEEEEENGTPPKKVQKIYTPSPKPVSEKRYDGYDHWPTVDSITSPRTCQYENCSSRTKSRCVKCDLYLCISKEKDCFRLFHIKWEGTEEVVFILCAIFVMCNF